MARCAKASGDSGAFAHKEDRTANDDSTNTKVFDFPDGENNILLASGVLVLNHANATMPVHASTPLDTEDAVLQHGCPGCATGPAGDLALEIRALAGPGLPGLWRAVRPRHRQASPRMMAM